MGSDRLIWTPDGFGECHEFWIRTLRWAWPNVKNVNRGHANRGQRTGVADFSRI
jgi:hypothetical protein